MWEQTTSSFTDWPLEGAEIHSLLTECLRKALSANEAQKNTYLLQIYRALFEAHYTELQAWKVTGQNFDIWMALAGLFVRRLKKS